MFHEATSTLKPSARGQLHYTTDHLLHFRQKGEFFYVDKIKRKYYFVVVDLAFVRKLARRRALWWVFILVFVHGNDEGCGSPHTPQRTSQ